MLRIKGIRLTIDQPVAGLKKRVSHLLRVSEEDILSLSIVKESIDARKRNEIYFTYVVDVTVKKEERFHHKKIANMEVVTPFSYELPKCGKELMKHRPVVIGFGPAGMFAALTLAQAGYCPIVYERGEEVDKRIVKVQKFWETGVLDPTSNVQFGEGGAGTFSDGKLTTRGKDPRAMKVLETFIQAGAPEQIAYEAHPHIGTDRLREIVKNIRKRIIELGGEIHFEACLDGIVCDGNQLTGIMINGEEKPCNELILAIGHSARDTFETLFDHHVDMEGKPFAVGVRVEHPQTLIDQAQYGVLANHPRLKAAEYRMSHQASNDRGVYTFCMCPGGLVVPSASSKEHLVVNGMSEYARDKVNANSAILVQVTPDDYGPHALDGIRYLEALEHKAFVLGGSNYHAPIQRVEDFLNNQTTTKLGDVTPSYAIGVRLTNLRTLFSPEIVQALAEGIQAFDRQLHGFALPDAVLTAVESRTSSPVRIIRDRETCISTSIQGLYPCGEGAGYAGGIVSAAIDGIRCSEAIIKVYHPEIHTR